MIPITGPAAAAAAERAGLMAPSEAAFSASVREYATLTGTPSTLRPEVF